MFIASALLFGFAGGVLLPYDPVPLRVLQAQNGPEVDGPPGPILPPFVPKPCYPCDICRGFAGAAVAGLSFYTFSLPVLDFWQSGALALAAGVTGGSLASAVNNALCAYIDRIGRSR